MSTYRRVLTTYWTDPDVRRACRKPEEHALLLYLFTGPDSTLSGLYWQPLEDMASRIRLPLEVVEELVARFERFGFILYDRATEEVLVRRAWKCNVGPELHERDNRAKALFRQVTDTHSDLLVGALVEAYPDFPWPEEVLSRVENRQLEAPNSDPTPPGRGSEGAPKGLPPRQDAALRVAEGASEGLPGRRGFEATHTHTHTHTKKPVENRDVENSTEPSDEPGADELSGPAGGGADGEVWVEVRKVAQEQLGMGRLSYRDEQRNRAILNQWRYGEERSASECLSAIRGAVKLRDEGGSWLEKGQPYTLAALCSTRTVTDYGDGGVVRPLWGVAQEADRKTDDPHHRSRTGPVALGDVLRSMAQEAR